MSKESEVEGILGKHLKDHGFEVKERTRKHGVDVTAFKDGKVYYVEVEGNTKPDGTLLTTSQKYTHLLRAVGQICLRMNDDPDAVYEIVFGRRSLLQKENQQIADFSEENGCSNLFCGLKWDPQMTHTNTSARVC